MKNGNITMNEIKICQGCPPLPGDFVEIPPLLVSNRLSGQDVSNQPQSGQDEVPIGQDTRPWGHPRRPAAEEKSELLYDETDHTDDSDDDSYESSANRLEECMDCCKYFGLFCCPPGVCCVTSVMFTRLALVAPEPSYDIVRASPKVEVKDDNRSGMKHYLSLKSSTSFKFPPEFLDYIRIGHVVTKRKKEVACMYVRCVDDPRFTVLYSHPNGADLGFCASNLVGLGLRLHVNVVTYDYAGYGASKGRATEANVYGAIEAVWHAMQTRLGVKPEDAILYGQSIGSGPTCHLAAKVRVAGVVIHSGFMSGMRVICPNKTTLCCFKPGRCCDNSCDAFMNISKCSKIESPVLVIHGDKDDMVHVKHGRVIYKSCRLKVPPLFLSYAGHNDIEMYKKYWDRMENFLSVDLGRKRPPTATQKQKECLVSQSVEGSTRPCIAESSATTKNGDAAETRRLHFDALAARPQPDRRSSEPWMYSPVARTEENRKDGSVSRAPESLVVQVKVECQENFLTEGTFENATPINGPFSSKAAENDVINRVETVPAKTVDSALSIEAGSVSRSNESFF